MPEQLPPQTYYTVSEIARHLKITSQAIHKAIKAGKLKTERVGESRIHLITAENLKAYETQRETK